MNTRLVLEKAVYKNEKTLYNWDGPLLFLRIIVVFAWVVRPKKRGEMKTGKALALALGVAVVSAVLLTFVNGAPTSEQLWGGVTTMFIIAFTVLKFWK